jgi:hypothetical protein
LSLLILTWASIALLINRSKAIKKERFFIMHFFG